MTDLEWPTWHADDYIYRVIPVSPRETSGDEFVVTREALDAFRADLGMIRAYLIRAVMGRAERATGTWPDPAGFDVALVDDRYPWRPLARDVQALRDRDLFIRDELRNHAK